MVNTEWWRHRGPRAWTGAECGESGEYTSGDDRFLGGQPAPAPPLPRSSCTLQPSPPAQLTRMCHLQMCQEGDFKNIFLDPVGSLVSTLWVVGGLLWVVGHTFV